MYKLSIYHPNLHSFPTLRSSDLTQRRNSKVAARVQSNSQPPSSFSHFRCRDESRCSSLVGSTVLAPEKCPAVGLCLRQRSPAVLRARETPPSHARSSTRQADAVPQ